MSENQNTDFDAIVGGINDDDLKDAQITTLLERVDELTKRVAFYEQQGRMSREARRLMMKAQTRDDAIMAATLLRDSLRLIHPTTDV
jgi:hypothetical protein